jgi:hypothetical protein
LIGNVICKNKLLFNTKTPEFLLVIYLFLFMKRQKVCDPTRTRIAKIVFLKILLGRYKILSIKTRNKPNINIKFLILNFAFLIIDDNHYRIHEIQ